MKIIRAISDLEGTGKNSQTRENYKVFLGCSLNKSGLSELFIASLVAVRFMLPSNVTCFPFYPDQTVIGRGAAQTSAALGSSFDKEKMT